jgi:HindVP restriction endonuclease
LKIWNPGGNAGVFLLVFDNCLEIIDGQAMVISESNPRLYGIQQSNRKGNDLWGKNQFNSTFPASLACWMRDKEYSANFLKLDCKTKKVVVESLSFDTVFNSKKANADLEFLFESTFDPYRGFLDDKLGNIDLVIRDKALAGDSQWCRALEVKLTVLPDHATAKKINQSDWGCELVIRPASTSYAALGIFRALGKRSKEALELFKPIETSIQDWANSSEMLQNRLKICGALEEFLLKFADMQIPFLMQPIWKTKGISPEFDENAFDVFVWSDFALWKVIVEKAKSETPSKKVSRYFRSCIRFIKCMYDLVSTGKVNVGKIFKAFPHGKQTDKELALGGRITNKYMKCARLEKPIVRLDALSEIIIGGGERVLSPERRFDASVFFTAKHLFENKT